MITTRVRAGDLRNPDRVELATLCSDADSIPKVEGAGSICQDNNGAPIQLMHNGVRVVADGYYGHFNSEIVEKLRGHHEPQEEKVFHEVLKLVKSGSVMIELGAYWSYYSLWFQQVTKGVNFMVEPVAENLKVGQRNFELNGFDGTFIHAFVGDQTSDATRPPTITVGDLAARNGLTSIEMLHADIQGHEFAMLLGAKDLIRAKRVRFVFISTHGFAIHGKCLAFLRRHGYGIIAEHTLSESYSVDGLIAAGSDSAIATVQISKKPQTAIEFSKSLFCRIFSRFEGWLS